LTVRFLRPDRLHPPDDELEPFRIMTVRHDASHGRDKIAVRLEVVIDVLHRLTPMSLGADGIKEHLPRLAEVTFSRRQRNIHIMVAGRD
jgi:hypothetical protein